MKGFPRLFHAPIFRLPYNFLLLTYVDGRLLRQHRDQRRPNADSNARQRVCLYGERGRKQYFRLCQ